MQMALSIGICSSIFEALVTMKRFLYCTGLLLGSFQLWAQDVVVSPPQKVVAGLSRVEVLGRNAQGIIVLHTIRDDDQIEAFYDNMQIHWKRSVPRKEKNARTEEIFLQADSVVFFYTHSSKGMSLLKAFKTSSRIETPSSSITCDTITRNYVSSAPALHFVRNLQKSRILVWYEDPNFENNRIIHLVCLNSRLKRIWKSFIRLEDFEHPDVQAATLDSAGNVCLVSGEFKMRNYNNDFPYTRLAIARIDPAGNLIKHSFLENKPVLFSSCLVREDPLSRKLMLAGFYAREVGVQSEGVYLFQYDLVADSIVFKKYEAHSVEFLSQLSGNTPPKKQDAFYNFKARELISTRNAGVLLITQSESVTTESYAGPPIGGFGGASGFTVNYYHYDDLAVYSFNGSGELEWKQILHKKQSTEGDGGYYSSFCTLIGPEKVNLIYNDEIHGQTTIAAYSLDTAGQYKREEIFSADRKGVMITPRHSKQISINEMILPSFRRNYLQFVKITF